MDHAVAVCCLGVKIRVENRVHDRLQDRDSLVDAVDALFAARAGDDRVGGSYKLLRVVTVDLLVDNNYFFAGHGNGATSKLSVIFRNQP